MWIIKLKFVGKEGTYTKEEESATDEFYAKMKYLRMLTRWRFILCQKVVVDSMEYDNCDLILKTIQFNLSLLNDGSTFEISMQEEKEE